MFINLLWWILAPSRGTKWKKQRWESYVSCCYQSLVNLKVVCELFFHVDIFSNITAISLSITNMIDGWLLFKLMMDLDRLRNMQQTSSNGKLPMRVGPLFLLLPFWCRRSGGKDWSHHMPIIQALVIPQVAHGKWVCCIWSVKAISSCLSAASFLLSGCILFCLVLCPSCFSDHLFLLLGCILFYLALCPSPVKGYEWKTLSCGLEHLHCMC